MNGRRARKRRRDDDFACCHFFGWEELLSMRRRHREESMSSVFVCCVSLCRRRGRQRQGKRARKRRRLCQVPGKVVVSFSLVCLGVDDLSCDEKTRNKQRPTRLFFSMSSVSAHQKQLFPSSRLLFLACRPFTSMTSPATTKTQQTNSVYSFQCCRPWHSTGTVSTQPFFGWKQSQLSAKANNIEKSRRCLFMPFFVA